MQWASIEQKCGSYDFTAYDTLLAEMKAVGVQPYWILDYSNPCYGPDKGCDTLPCIAAYGRLATAAAAHFKGNGIIWESTNEPNGMGSENATDIAALCAAAGGAFRAAGEFFVGPATAGIDFNYLNASFAAGLLSSVSGVSVHPYRRWACSLDGGGGETSLSARRAPLPIPLQLQPRDCRRRLAAAAGDDRLLPGRRGPAHAGRRVGVRGRQ